tara:strand:- start:1160 stop:1366 length:207 start_codon:yes stop_codon:yes gene_type:complete
MNMRVLVKNYGDARVFKDRPYGYKRFIVEWLNGQSEWPGNTEIYSGMWYSEKQILQKVEKRLENGLKS